MRRTLSPCLATAAMLSLAVVAPAGAKPSPRLQVKADPTVLKHVQRAYAVFRTPKTKTDVITGLQGVPKRDRQRLARAQSRFLTNVSGVAFYAMVTGKQLIFMSVPLGDGYLGAGGRFAAGPIDPLDELRQVVRVPYREVVPAVVRGALVADGTTNALRRNADGTTTPLRVFRNLVADVSDGTGTLEWTRPDGTTGSMPAADPAAFGPQP